MTNPPIHPNYDLIMGKFPDSMTVGEVRAYLRENLDAGFVCPACFRFGQVYERKIYKTPCKVLVRLWVLRKFQVTDINAFVKAQSDFKAGDYGDFSKFKYWGIVEQMVGERKDGSKRVGKYRITTHGADFVQNNIAVPKECRVYDDVVLSWHPEQVKIKEVLENRKGKFWFNYNELMHYIPREDF